MCRYLQCFVHTISLLNASCKTLPAHTLEEHRFKAMLPFLSHLCLGFFCFIVQVIHQWIWKIICRVKDRKDLCSQVCTFFYFDFAKTLWTLASSRFDMFVKGDHSSVQFLTWNQGAFLRRWCRDVSAPWGVRDLQAPPRVCSAQPASHLSPPQECSAFTNPIGIPDDI